MESIFIREKKTSKSCLYYCITVGILKLHWGYEKINPFHVITQKQSDCVDFVERGIYIQL